MSAFATIEFLRDPPHAALRRDRRRSRAGPRPSPGAGGRLGTLALDPAQALDGRRRAAARQAPARPNLGQNNQVALSPALAGWASTTRCGRSITSFRTACSAPETGSLAPLGDN